MTAEIFNLVSISIRRTHLYGRGQVEDNRVILRRAHFLHNRFADSYREINLCTGKAFRRIFVANIHAAACNLLLRQLTNKLRTLHGNLGDALHILTENNLTLQGRCRIVKVNNNILRTAYSLKGFANQLLACLHQHLHRYVVRNMTALNKRAQNFVLRFGGRGKAHFDFLEAAINQRMEKFELLRNAHRCHQRLIAIAQVNAAPNRCFGNSFFRPLAVLQDDRIKGNIFLFLLHCKFLLNSLRLCKSS